jgi:hypothetical protein
VRRFIPSEGKGNSDDWNHARSRKKSKDELQQSEEQFMKKTFGNSAVGGSE